MASRQVPKIKLNDGREIPQIGLGTWKMFDEKECRQAVGWALEAGYRHIDTAQLYKNEQFVGAALQESGIPRSDVFITTKIWMDNFTPGRLEKSFEESLGKLQTDYVDLLLLHWPVSLLRDNAWRKLEEIHQGGKGAARSIGASNYTVRHLEHLLKFCKVKPAVNQVELHVFLQQPELVKLCQDVDITVVAYSPLARTHGMDNPILSELADKHGKTAAQIMLRWCIDSGKVAIPKSSHQERIRQNIDIFDFELDGDDLDKLRRLDEGHRIGHDPALMP